MPNRHFALTLTTPILLAAALAAGCRGGSPAGPAAVPGAGQPAAPVTITAVAPVTGSTTGSTPLTLTGSGFQAGASVAINGLSVRAAVADGGSILRFSAPPHAVGSVTIVVTNPDGGEARIAGAYAYAPAETFDFDGEWFGGAGAEFDTALRFTVRGGVLVSVRCGAANPITYDPAPAVHNGEFSIVAADGHGISARIVSATDAVGTIDIAPCSAMNWMAKRVI